MVVLHRPFQGPLDEVLTRLSARGLPNLWIPDRESFVEVQDIPMLGSGKVDLKQAKQLALAKLDERRGG